MDIEKLDQAAEMLKCIAHPTRLSIIHLLEKNEEMSVSDIHTQLNIEQAVASHHLSKMKSKNVLQSRREGKSSLYSLKNKEFSFVLSCIEKCMKGD